MIRLRGWAVWFLNRLGDSAAQAIVIGERLLADQEQVLGPDHPDTLTSRNNLALAYRGAGRTGEAITLDEQALAARERVLGPDHPDTLTARSNLATTYRAAGRTGEAITLYEQILADQRTCPGPRPPRHLDLAQQPRRRLPGGGPHRRGDHPGRAGPGRPANASWARTTPTP